MSVRWNRAFAVLLGLSLTTAVLSFVVVQQIESTFAAAIGIASQANAADSGDHLLGAVAVAMYGAKGQGKHRWQLFDHDVHGPIVDDASSIPARLQAADLDSSPLP